MLRWTPAIGATALVVALLAGCSPPPEPPRPATAEEIQALREAQARDWWDSFAQGEPMPVVEVIEALPPEESYERQATCVIEADIPGVEVAGDGSFSYLAVDDDDPTFQLVMQQHWICSQQYPVEGEEEYILSQSELTWLYDFYVNRHRPCLGSLGFEFVHFPQREHFLGDTAGYPGWVPDNYSVDPAPTPTQWALIAERCPLPSLLDPYGLPGFGPLD